MKLKLFFISLAIITGIIIGIIFYKVNQPSVKVNMQEKNLKIFTLQELSKFNGVDSRLPIYLALDGYVYDITKGKKFYQVGGSYHYLAGKDSSRELHLVGAGIIKNKYPIVGKL